jgi:flagellar basal body-associated protein FliL
LPSGGVVAEGFKMNLKPNKQSKTFFALAIVLAIAIVAATQLTAVNAQTSGTITINNNATYTNSTAVTLTISATNATEMCFSNDNSAWTSWENYTTTKNWTIPNTEGTETVYAQFRDSANQTGTASASITLDVTAPIPELEWQPASSDYKTVSFSAYYSIDNFGIKNATVEFGDGNFTVLANSQFTHTYASVGNYTVTLTMTDVAGNVASIKMNVTVPDASTITTPTPAPTVTTQPTFNPTNEPTVTESPPSSTTAPITLDPLTMIVLVGAVGIIVVVVLAIILVLRRKPKAAKPKEQQSTPTQSPPPQQKPQPSTPSGPSESNFNI